MAAETEGVWKPYKELLDTVERAVYRKKPEFLHDLEISLKKFKPDFLTLLKKPAKNAAHRTEIKNAATNGIFLGGQQDKQKLPEPFIQEALILSDILELNEYVCAELLLTGEQQQPNFPGLTRGLVAVLLYHDGRRCLLNSLKILLQSREGITWTLGVGEDVSECITKYTDELVKEGLIKTILTQLKQINIQSELEKLQKGQAIGDDHHKRKLIEFITEQRHLLAECVFCISCQSPLVKIDCLQLLSFLKECCVTEADGTLDCVTLTLLMAVLYCFNGEPLDEAAEMQTSFSEQSLPLLSDNTFITNIHQALFIQDGWTSRGLLACVQLSWSLLLRSCNQWAGLVSAPDVLEDDESLLDLAIDGNVFDFLRSSIVKAKTFHQEDYFVRRLHHLVTDFIVKMPLKVKELRNHGDEACRIIQACLQDNREPPSDLPRHFEDFLRLIGDLYSQDPCDLHLADEYWCPPDPINSSQYETHNFTSPMYNQRLSSKQVSLHKFVRLAGDLLPPPLFIPYMEMLVGLASSPQGAHHCFNLLKNAASNHISWDHFFTSIKQYYVDLRQDVGQIGYGGKDVNQTYRVHVGNRGIMPAEQEAMMEVLKVTKTIAENDETARIALCDSQSWLPIASLFGLLSCPIDIRLKGCILDTLAAFAKSPEVASSLWHTLELSQILVTVQPSGQTTLDRGLQVELNEIESRSESYPVTRSFLGLLKELTDIPIPMSLGSGYRTPGFEPYLMYLRDDVFLKFNSRGYQNIEEKWQVSCKVLEVLFKLLEDYIPQPGDFVDQYLEAQGGQRILAAKPPGFTLMVHLLNDTPMLRMILSIIDTALVTLEELQNTSAGKKELERTTLLCLRMLELALEKQGQFMDMLRTVPQRTSVLLSPLEQLLMGINPQSQSADYLLKIARYLTLSSIGPELCLSAVKILCLVSQSQAVQSHMVGLFTADKSVSLKLLIGFVEHLEISDPEESFTKDTQEIGQEFLNEKSYNTSQVNNAIRQNIVRLMIHSLDFPAPNLAHYLLGYELRRPISKTTLQLPGVLGSPKTCLHSILQVLNCGVETQTGPACITEAPHFTELSYKLIYHLCAHKDTFMPTLRYLRTSHDFLYQHLQHLPFSKLVAMEIQEGVVSPLHILNQQSWLLKTAAIEIKITAQSRQRSHTQRLLALLLKEPSALSSALGVSQIPDLSRTLNKDVSTMDASLYQTNLFAPEPVASLMQARRKILAILDSVEFTQDFPSPLQLNYFDQSVMERVISSCEQKSDDTGLIYCNVRELHRLLMAEISGAQNAATAGQKNFLVEEVKDILQNVVQRNMVRESLQGKKEAIESWRQVVEIILATCGYDVLPRDTKQSVILETLQDLLIKIAEDNALSELIAPVSGVILMLMTHLRHSTLPWETPITPTPILDSSLQPGQSDTLCGTTTPSGPMFAILRGLIEAVLRSGGGLQRVRANLYAAILYFMQMAQKSKASNENRGVLEGILSQSSESWELGTLSVLSSYGEPFMETVCRDACDGHDVGRMLAFSLLDSIVAIDWQRRWLGYFNNKGFLRNIIEGLAQDDERLLAMLDPSPEPLKALYIYESKMALMACIAQSPEGAEVLIQSGLMSRLAECSFLSKRPEYESHGFHSDSFVPTVMDRYRQLLLPALKVIGTVLTSLGPGHHEASMKVLGVVAGHADVFISVLQDRQPTHNTASLQELSLVTSIICNAGLTEASLLEDDSLLEDVIQFRGPLARIQRLMMALLPKYCSKDYWNKVVKSSMDQVQLVNDTSNGKLSIAALETGIKLRQICANVIGYCKTIVNATGSSGSQYHVIFGPGITDSLIHDTRPRRDSYRAPSISSRHPPSLGILVGMVKECSDSASKSVETHKQTTAKLENIQELTTEELKEICQLQSSVTPHDKIPTQQRQQLAQKCLNQIVSFKKKEVDIYLYIVENSMFLLWRHLDYYLQHCIPSDEEHSMLHSNTSAAGKMRRLHDWSTNVNVSNISSVSQNTILSGKVTRDEIQLLKQEAKNCLTEPLLKKLAELEQDHCKDRTRVGFIRVLIRRIKGLLKLHGGLVNEPIPGR